MISSFRELIDRKKDLQALLERESAAVYESSMAVLKEMEALDDLPTEREGPQAET